MFVLRWFNLRSQVSVTVCARGTGGRVRWWRAGNRQGKRAVCVGGGICSMWMRALGANADTGGRWPAAEAASRRARTVDSGKPLSVQTAGACGGQRDACAGGGRWWQTASGGRRAVGLLAREAVSGERRTARGGAHRETGSGLQAASLAQCVRVRGNKQRPALAGASSGWRAGGRAPGVSAGTAHASAAPPPPLLRTSTHAVVHSHGNTRPWGGRAREGLPPMNAAAAAAAATVVALVAAAVVALVGQRFLVVVGRKGSVGARDRRVCGCWQRRKAMKLHPVELVGRRSMMAAKFKVRRAVLLAGGIDGSIDGSKFGSIPNSQILLDKHTHKKEALLLCPNESLLFSGLAAGPRAPENFERTHIRCKIILASSDFFTGRWSWCTGGEVSMVTKGHKLHLISADLMGLAASSRHARYILPILSFICLQLGSGFQQSRHKQEIGDAREAELSKDRASGAEQRRIKLVKLEFESREPNDKMASMSGRKRVASPTAEADVKDTCPRD
ncbi:hypothetical protein GGX14DRAFT_396627 [Mycena pura]|uniref:Uncharacterized protein n=1 Tax=Mycena pura TaxID=153505 RepID=A0AAD6VCD5_9AGAR|nr:hypothetical protein GGX14DRAFT_396627 [Mycena pura]